MTQTRCTTVGGANPERITFGTAGKYLVGAGVDIAFHATGQRYIAIKLNGATYIALRRWETPATAGANSNMGVETLYDFSAGDYIEIEVFQSSGVALNTVVTGDTAPEAWAQKVDRAG